MLIIKKKREMREKNSNGINYVTKKKRRKEGEDARRIGVAWNEDRKSRQGK